MRPYSKQRRRNPMIQHLKPHPRGPRLLRRLSGETGADDSLWQVLRAGRPYYPGCRVVMLSVNGKWVGFEKIL